MFEAEVLEIVDRSHASDSLELAVEAGTAHVHAFRHGVDGEFLVADVVGDVGVEGFEEFGVEFVDIRHCGDSFLLRKLREHAVIEYSPCLEDIGYLKLDLLDGERFFHIDVDAGFHAFFFCLAVGLGGEHDEGRSS